VGGEYSIPAKRAKKKNLTSPNFFRPPPQNVGDAKKQLSQLFEWVKNIFSLKNCIRKDVANKDMTFFETILQKCINKTSRN